MPFISGMTISSTPRDEFHELYQELAYRFRLRRFSTAAVELEANAESAERTVEIVFFLIYLF